MFINLEKQHKPWPKCTKILLFFNWTRQKGKQQTDGVSTTSTRQQKQRQNLLAVVLSAINKEDGKGQVRVLTWQFTVNNMAFSRKAQLELQEVKCKFIYFSKWPRLWQSTRVDAHCLLHQYMTDGQAWTWFCAPKHSLKLEWLWVSCSAYSLWWPRHINGWGQCITHWL